jgi:hypothetical protein
MGEEQEGREVRGWEKGVGEEEGDGRRGMERGWE